MRDRYAAAAALRSPCARGRLLGRRRQPRTGSDPTDPDLGATRRDPSHRRRPAETRADGTGTAARLPALDWQPVDGPP